MTVEQYAKAVCTIALSEGVVAHERYRLPEVWAERFKNGFSPAEAWQEEQHDAMRAF
jgi:hypothetical protein